MRHGIRTSVSGDVGTGERAKTFMERQDAGRKSDRERQGRVKS